LTKNVIGSKSITRVDSFNKVTGNACFSADVKLPGMLYGQILMSPHPHAQILNIDTSKAEKLPGVKAVITSADTPLKSFGIFPSTRDQYPMAVDKVRFVGEPVAAVAAVDPDTAEEALKLIKVQYKILPAVFEPAEALQDGVPLVHEATERNKCLEYKVVYGNMEEGFAQADLVREDTFTMEALAHCQLEPYVAVANFQPAGKLEVWVPNQSPFSKRTALARTLQMNLSDIRLHPIEIGGAFGGLSEMGSAEFCAALLSKKARRPVKLVYSREQTMIAIRQKHPMEITVKTGMTKDGLITAKDLRILADGGAYHSTSGIALTNPFIMFLALYRIPNVSYEAIRVYTNKGPRGAMRGHGNQQLRFADGAQLDWMAEELGLDPLEVRLKNAVQSGDVLLNGAKVHSCGFSESLEKVGEKSGWKEKRQSTPQPYRGIGVGAGIHICGFDLGVRSKSGAIIKFNEDGKANILTGSIENGQGNKTMHTQIAAETLGLPMEDFSLTCGDTDLTPSDPGTYTMSTAYISGNAVLRAAQDARNQILTTAAKKLKVDAQELDIANRRIFIKGKPEQSIGIKEVLIAGLVAGTQVIGQGEWRPSDVTPVNWMNGKIDGQPTGAYSYGAAVAEVEVDPVTYHVKVLNVTAAHDCGHAINPKAVEGQFEGSVAFGIGQALSEELIWKDGRVLNAGFLDYKSCLAGEMPPVESIIIESQDPAGPFGAKEAGMTVSIAAVEAVANAVHNALKVKFDSLPITPEKIQQKIAKGW